MWGLIDLILRIESWQLAKINKMANIAPKKCLKNTISDACNVSPNSFASELTQTISIVAMIPQSAPLIRVKSFIYNI